MKRGFTLIELLVVIAIISLLSSIVLASLQGARVKARDSKRVQDLIQLRTALELYYAKNGEYPANVSPDGGSGRNGGDCWDCASTIDYDIDRLAVLGEFLNPRPIDPNPGPGSFCGYWYITNPPNFTEYKMAILGNIENKTNVPLPLLDDNFHSAVAGVLCQGYVSDNPNFTSASVSSRGARCWTRTGPSTLCP